jgi:hypothetical protein
MVKCLTFSTNGKLLALGGDDGSITVLAWPSLSTRADLRCASLPGGLRRRLVLAVRLCALVRAPAVPASWPHFAAPYHHHGKAGQGGCAALVGSVLARGRWAGCARRRAERLGCLACEPQTGLHFLSRSPLLLPCPPLLLSPAPLEPGAGSDAAAPGRPGATGAWQPHRGTWTSAWRTATRCAGIGSCVMIAVSHRGLTLSVDDWHCLPAHMTDVCSCVW